jgi:hypothetical protein
MAGGVSRTHARVNKIWKRFAVMLAALTLLGATTPPPNQKIIELLSTISHFDDASLIAISYWASAQNPQPPDADLTDLDHVEIASVQLPPDQRDALFTWLDHGGRQKLLALGLTDDEIGPCQKLIDPQPCKGIAAAPPSIALSGYRSLTLRLAPADPASGLELQGGFAILSGSSTLAHCIGFRNASNKTAAAITFTYQLLDAANDVLEAGSDILVGSFSPSTTVPNPSPGGIGGWLGGGAAEKPQNCWLKTSDAGATLAHGTTLAVEVASVTFEDGTHWSR